jgi:hypothetical protein
MAIRKAAFPLGMVVSAGIAGLALAALALKPSAAILVGLLLLAGVVVFVGVETDKIARFAVGLLALTITWNGIRLGGGASSNTTASGGAFGDATMVIAFAAVMADAIRRRRSVPLPPWLLLAGLGCIVAAVVTMIFPPSIKLVQESAISEATLAQQTGTVGQVGSLGLGENLLILIEYLLALILIPVMVATVATTVRRCRLVMDLWTTGAIINGAAGILGLAGIHIASSAAVANRSAGLTIQPNYLALTCVIALPMALLWFGRSRRYNVAAAIGMVALLGGVYASGSRAGFGGAIIALLVTIVAVPRLRRALPYLLPVAGTIFVIFLLFTSTGHKLLVQVRLASPGGANISASGSNYQRSLVANTAWSEIQVRPLSGVGWAVVTGAHDIYLELLNAAGAIGLASFLVFIGGMVASLRRALAGPLRDEAIVCGVGILAWLANGVFDNQVADKYLYLVPGLLLAIARTTWLLQSHSRMPRHTIESSSRPAPARALVGIGVP